MDWLAILRLCNYGLVLLFGLLLSVDIAGGYLDRRQKKRVVTLFPLFYLVQYPVWRQWGAEGVRQIYPLLVHLPMVLLLIFVFKRKHGVALVSVSTAYLCCQIPRWVKLMAWGASNDFVGELCYAVCIFPIYFLLHRYFVRAAYAAISYSRQSLLLFGSLPMAYYLFDYATTVYSDVLYAEVQMLSEFLPTLLIVFYVIFLTAYHTQVQRQVQTEWQNAHMATELKQSKTELENLRRADMQARIYRHDMRHHLTVIGGLIAAGKTEQATAYISKTEEQVSTISMRSFCGNEPINLMCSAFSERAEQMGVRLNVDARLSGEISVSDTELCAVISNSLENALHAVAGLETPFQWVNFYCGIKRNKLLIEVKNPCGEVVIQDGLPLSDKAGHGYGCRSIRSIAERHGGLCSFEAENGVFTFRMILPLLRKT